MSILGFLFIHLAVNKLITDKMQNIFSSIVGYFIMFSSVWIG